MPQLKSVIDISDSFIQHDKGLLVCVEALHHSQQFFSHVRTVSGLTSTKQRLKNLAQGHNKKPLVWLEPAAP